MTDEERPEKGAGLPALANDRPGRLPARSFDDEEIARILHKAAELQERAATLPHDTGGGLSLDELRQIALEAGIDPRFVDLAAADLDGDIESTESMLAGGPVQWHYNVSVAGEIDDGDRERIMLALRSQFGRKGALAEVFGRMEWTYDDGLGRIIIGISSRDGTTEVDVSSTRSGEAGLLHGLAVPFGAIGTTAILTDVLALSGPAFVFPMLALSGAALYGVTRFAWRFRARAWEKRLQRVVSRVTSIVEGAVSPPPPAADRTLPASPE